MLIVEQTSVSFDQFCCILTEFRNLPADNQRRFWDVMASKAATLLYSVVSPVSRILCKALQYVSPPIVGCVHDSFDF